MASRRHLEVVSGGAKAISEWWARRGRKFDLNSADLRNADLEGADLHLVDLRHADLRNANLERVDLKKALLSNANLSGVRLRGANLHEADLTEANVTRAGLIRAELSHAKLVGADLSRAELHSAKLDYADLRGANLTGATLYRADLTHADLRNAGLMGADLSHAILRSTALSGASFTGTKFYETVLATDLSEVTGIEAADHGGPSLVTLDALIMSRGRIPPSFWRSCGLNDWEIASARLYSPELSREEIDSILYEVSALRAGAAIQVSPLFISYSHRDGVFVDQLEEWLVEEGIRFWRDVHHFTAGRVEKQLMRAISINPTFLLVLSANSVNSDWVEWEAAKARELEKDLGRDVLCPVALDGSWKKSRWPGPLRRQIEDYHVLDFSQWKDGEVFKQQFKKLVTGLRLFYQPPQSETPA